MNTTTKPRLLTVLAAFVLAGSSLPAFAQETATQRKLAALGFSIGESVELLPEDFIDQWNYVNDHTVIVHGSETGNYLVTLVQDCPALQSASTIAFNTAIAPGLSSSGGLVVGSSASAPECGVGSIVRLEKSKAVSATPG